MFARRVWPVALVTMAMLAVGCGEPPEREMHQAQGAIDAARAAGAQEYAAQEYAAAVDALKRADEAVAQRDYRLALNNALDSRERAQTAAHEAADHKAEARGEVERTLAQLTLSLSQAQTRLEAAQTARVPARALREPRETLAFANAAVQEAGDAITAGDYPKASDALKGVKARVDGVVTRLDTTIAAATKRRRR